MQAPPDIDADELRWANPDDDVDPSLLLARPFRARVLLVLWPAFMVAALLEALVFVVIDPTAQHGFGSAVLLWPAVAVYSVAFLVFWALVAAAAAITLWLDKPGPWQAT
jgi:hypothetical protein